MPKNKKVRSTHNVTRPPSQIFIANKTNLTHAYRLASLPITGPIDPKNVTKEDTIPNQEVEKEKYVVDPDFSVDFVEKIDQHVKIVITAMLFAATQIWSVFFYSWYHLPQQLYAHAEIEKIFLPEMKWSGVYFVIASFWFFSIYCLFLVVYPDPRLWKYCCKPRRIWRWTPFIILLLYNVVVITFWLYQLYLVPRTIYKRMKASVKSLLNEQTTRFPSQWEFIQNYYQCCGIKSKDDWKHKIIPKTEIPFPYKNDGICTTFHYGKQNYTEKECTNGNLTNQDYLWPASCCNNYTTQNGCTVLPITSQIWTGACYNAETSLVLGTVITAMLLSIVILILGVFAFFKARILETIVLRQRLPPPKPHI